MKYINNTPIVKDSSELKAPYIFMYNQVFVQTEKIKIVIHHEIFPVYINKENNTIIHNEAVFYYLMDNDNNIITRYYSLYKALHKFNELK